MGGGEGTTGCPESFETWYRYRCQMGPPGDLSTEQIKSVAGGSFDNRVTERSWEDNPGKRSMRQSRQIIFHTQHN